MPVRPPCDICGEPAIISHGSAALGEKCLLHFREYVECQK